MNTQHPQSVQNSGPNNSVQDPEQSSTQAQSEQQSPVINPDILNDVFQVIDLWLNQTTDGLNSIYSRHQKGADEDRTVQELVLKIPVELSQNLKKFITNHYHHNSPIAALSNEFESTKDGVK
ncbi:MAG: hypothetical protein ACXWE3_01180 [Methylobacter sp.]